MEQNILNQILSVIDFGFVFICNSITYLLIKLLEEIKFKKQTSILFKRSITLIVGIIFGLVVYSIDNTNPLKLLYSFIFSLLSFDYIFKPILRKFKSFDYKKDI